MQNPKDDPREGPTSPRAKLSARDALLNDAYMQGNGEEQNVPFYFWDSTQGKAAAVNFGAVELLARKINQPGKIQSSGLLLAVDIKTGFITACSKNCQQFLRLSEEDVLGQQLVTIFKCEAAEVSDIFERVGPRAFSSRMCLRQINSEVEVTFSRAEGWALLEVETIRPEVDEEHALATAAIAETEKELQQAFTTEHLHHVIARGVQNVTGYDRVKIYKFHVDQHGEVLAEALRGTELESCLGLHYPATDIPQRARELFLMNPFRCIADVNAPQVDLVCLADSDVDVHRITMSSADLRAVHPCHIDYLRNMKVTASLSFAIVVKRKLWGLVACHHGNGPRMVARSIRTDCWYLVQTYTSRLAKLLQEQAETRCADVNQLKVALQHRLSHNPSKAPANDLIASTLDLFRNVLDCQGFAYVSSDMISKCGKTPSEGCIREIETALNTSAQPGMLDSRSLSSLLDGSLREDGGKKLNDVVGVLAVRCVRGCILMWFRQEYVREVRWGGRDEPLPDGVWGARQSFEWWAESVRGECNPWTEADEEDAMHIAIEFDRMWFQDPAVERMATTPRGNVLEWNKPMERLVCMSASKAVGQNISNLCYQCDKEDVENMLASVRANHGDRWTAHLNIYTQQGSGGASFQVWKRHNAESKQVLVFETLGFESHTPLPTGPPGTGDASPGSSTPKIPHATAPLQSEVLFRVPQDVLILDEVTDVSWIMDCSPQSGAYLWANKRACETFKCTLNQFLCLDLKPDFLDSRVRELWYSKVQQQREAMHCRQSFYADTAVRLDLTITPIQVETTHGPKVLCLVSGKLPLHDGMEGSRSMEMLQASKVMMMLFSSHGELLSANVSAKVYYSMALSEQHVRLEDVFESCEWESQSERVAAFNAMMQVCNGSGAHIYEMERVKKHKKAGVVHHIQFSAARDPETGALAIAVNETDISRLKSVQNELVAAQKQQERFLAATSHELRTPLHAILALSDNMQKNPQLPEGSLKMLKIIHSSGQQLASLVNDILDAAAIQAGALVLKNDLVQLHEVAGGVIDLLSPMSPWSVKLVNSVPTSLPMLQLDSARLTQILTNLLGNACKFTRAGEIRVKAEMQGSEQDQVAITVSDTGRGIAEEHLSSIWKAFQQVDPDVKGTGLGLTIVRNLVEAMGGMISVASSVEAGSAGTSFTVVLPRRPQDHVRRLLSEKPAAGADQQASKARREPAAESAGSDSSRRNSVASQSQHASCPTTPAGTWNPGMLSSSPKPRPSFSGESVESDGEARRSGGGDLRASGGSGGGGRGSPHVGDRGGGGGSGGRGGGGGGARGRVQESDMDLRAELESALAKLHAREHELEALKTHRAAEQHALLLAASSRLESRQSGTPPRELAPSTSFTADTDADSACPASSPTASASTFRRTSSALAPAPALRLRPCLLLSEAGAVKEEARRVLERLGVAPSVVCSLSEANLLAARPEPWPELELVLVDAGALGPAGARPSSVFGPGAGCGSLARLVKAQSVPVLWLTADPDADLDAALAAGCTGVAGLPLDADALQEVLFQQRDLQRLWLWRALLDSSALFPAPPAIARRAAALAQRADGVCQHALLAAVSLTLEFPAADRSRRSAHHALVSAATTASDASSAVHKLGQLLQQCAVAVHDVAEQRGALVTHAAGDAFTLVLLPPPSPSPRSSSPSHARASPTRRSPDAALDTATLAVAALELASALLRAFDTLPDMPDGKAPVARAGLAFGPGFEAVACGLPATSGKPVQTPSARRAQEAPTLAFFGAPLLGAAAMAGSADAGAVRMGGDVFRTLFPRAEASANEFSFSPASESWFALGPNAFVPAAALAPGALPNVAVHRLPAERGDAEKVGEEGGGERGFQAFAADMLRRGRARTLLRQMEDEPTGAARVARSDVALVAVAAAKVGRCAHTLFGGVPQGARRAESGGRGGGGGGGVATQSENPSDKNPPDGDRLLAKAHILSVDDSAVNQLVMESILRPLVRKLSSCMDGPDTLDVLEEGCDLPDIILLDVMMPSMSGLEVCRILRERYSPTQLPIVLVSGKSSKESIVEGLAAGANDYVTKPFDSAELLSRVKGQLMAAAMAKAEVQDAGTETIHRKMLPPAILRSWEARPAGEEVAEELEHASVLCAAIEGYSMLTSHASTREVVQALSALCLGFDELCEAGDAWRVQSAPDSYMVVAGQSQTDDDDHAARLATIGLDMIKVARSISHPVCPGSLKIRVAVHSGPVRNGVVAGSLPRYFVCGDTVDLTSRIVELTQPMTVTVSASSQRRLGQFQCLSLGRRRIGETCELETFVVKDKSSAWEAALECARRRSSIRSTTTTSSLLQDVPKYLASPLSASTTPATPVPKAPAHRPGKLQVVAVDDGFLDSGAASDVSHDDSSTLGASDLSASVERSVASPASQRRAGAPRTAPAARESRKRPQQPPAALEQQQQQQHQQHQQLAIEQQQQQQQQQQQPASMASSHNNNPHAWPASLRTAWPAVEARGCDVVAVTASSGYRWRTDPLLFVLERAKVPHLGPVLAKEGVEVDFLAHAEELELKALGLENISERARVQRFAKAWMLLHADTA